MSWELLNLAHIDGEPVLLPLIKVLEVVRPCCLTQRGVESSAAVYSDSWSCSSNIGYYVGEVGQQARTCAARSQPETKGSLNGTRILVQTRARGRAAG